MIILIWFSVVCFLMLLGLTICALTFRHWYVEARAKRQKIADSDVEITVEA